MFTTTSLLPLLLSTLPLATPQLTTSIRLPSPYQDNTHIGFLASLVGVSSSTTTLALHFDNTTNLQSAGYLIDHAPNTMTFSSNAFAAVSTLPATLSTPAATVTYGCAFTAETSAGGVCSFVSDGADVKSKACGGHAGGKAPAWCEGGDVPVEERQHTYGVEPQDVATYQVIITAGLEKLSATGGPSVEAKRPVATGAVTLHRGQNVVPQATATGNAPVEATGGAVMVGGRPAMVGLGVGVLAAVLM